MPRHCRDSAVAYRSVLEFKSESAARRRVRLDYSTSSLDSVTLVTARLHSETPVDRRIRLENQLDGPVMPPRTNGIPVDGWDDDGYETVVPAGSSVALGYACPAPERDPPLVVVSSERVFDSASALPSDSVGDAVRRLGQAAPPRDAIADGVDHLDHADPDSATEPDDADTQTASTGDIVLAEPADAPSGSGAAETTVATDIPESIHSWFDTVETRTRRAERLTAPSVQTATHVLDDAGGLAAVEGLQKSVDDDAVRLRAIAERATGLAERAEEADVAWSALRRLA